MSFLAVLKNAAGDAVESIYIEPAAEQVTQNLEADADGVGPNIDYYSIQVGPAPNFPVSTPPVTLKGGARAPGPATEIAVIEANGQDLGSAVVEV
jgi:hypothetical protein